MNANVFGERWKPNLSPLWADQSSWPLDYAGHELLLRAADRVGAAIYPGAWKGNELAVAPYIEPQLPALRQVAGYTVEQSRQVHDFLTTFVPELKIAPFRNFTAAPPPPPRLQAPAPSLSLTRPTPQGPDGRAVGGAYYHLTYADLFFVHQVNDQRRADYNAKCAPLLERAAEVKKALRAAVLHGLISSGWQTSYDGSVKPLANTLWNLPCWTLFFDLGKVDWEKEFMTGKRPAFLSWIFLDRSGVDTLIAGIEGAILRIAEGQRASAAPENDRQDWWPAKGEQPKRWMFAAATVAELEVRVGQDPREDNKSTRSKLLAEMWNESDAPKREDATFYKYLPAAGSEKVRKTIPIRSEGSRK